MALKYLFKNDIVLSKEQQLKKRTAKGFFIASIIFVTVLAVGGLVIVPKLIGNAKIQAVEEYANSEMIKVYMTSTPIGKGKPIDKDTLVQVDMPKNKVSTDTAMSVEDFNKKVSRIDLGENTMLTYSMLVSDEEEITSDLRRQDYNHIILNNGLQVGQYVDIRMKQKNGEDFIVAPKKKVLFVNGQVSIFNITEAERQLINNATVKASLQDGSVYTTIYVDGENQDKASVTYRMDRSVDNLIKDNPKVVKEAQDKLNDNRVGATPNGGQ